MIVAVAGADLLAAIIAWRNHAVERAFDRGFEVAVIAHHHCCIPGVRPACGLGALAQLVGGLLGHPDRLRSMGHGADHRKRLDEVVLAPWGPAVVAGAGDGSEGERIGLGFGRSGGGRLGHPRVYLIGNPTLEGGSDRGKVWEDQPGDELAVAREADHFSGFHAVEEFLDHLGSLIDLVFFRGLGSPHGATWSFVHPHRTVKLWADGQRQEELNILSPEFPGIQYTVPGIPAPEFPAGIPCPRNSRIPAIGWNWQYWPRPLSARFA